MSISHQDKLSFLRTVSAVGYFVYPQIADYQILYLYFACKDRPFLATKQHLERYFNTILKI